jgi:hypothetical protein
MMSIWAQIYNRSKISPRAVFVPAVFDFALREIKHGEQTQKDFDGFNESELKNFAVHGRLSSMKQQLINTHMVLCVNRIPPEQKNGFLRCFAYFEYCRSKNLTGCSPGNSLLCRIPNTAGGTLSGTPSSNEH